MIALLVPAAYKAKQTYVTKNCIKLVEKILAEGKMDIRIATNRLILKLYECLGSVLIENVASNCLQKVMDIINSSL